MVLSSSLRNQKKESELANALAQWRKVEATLSSKDAEYTKLLSDNRSLSDEFTDLQSQLENVRPNKSMYRVTWRFHDLW